MVKNLEDQYMRLLIIFVMVFIVPVSCKGISLESSVCPGSEIRYDDGDSFSCRGEDIRVLGVDAPEIRHEKHGILVDQPRGKEAAAFTKDIMIRAKRIAIIKGGKDKYGRRLAHVLIDGDLLAVKIIQKGLGYETISQYGDNGFPEFSIAIKEAAASSPKPDFENPSDWRKKNQL